MSVLPPLCRIVEDVGEGWVASLDSGSCLRRDVKLSTIGELDDRVTVGPYTPPRVGYLLDQDVAEEKADVVDEPWSNDRVLNPSLDHAVDDSKTSA